MTDRRRSAGDHRPGRGRGDGGHQPPRGGGRRGGRRGPALRRALRAGRQRRSGRLVRKRLFPLDRRAAPAGSPGSTSTTPPARPCWRWSSRPPGVFNIVDDEPARSASGCPTWPSAPGPSHRGGSRPWLARLLAGEMAVAMMTEGRGFSNAKAKRELGWPLRYPSWRQGFKDEFGMTRAEEFEELRPLLFSIAYRILGSVSEAEDAVQETWLRYAGLRDGAPVDQGVPVGRRDPDLDRRAALGPGPAGGVRRALVPRAAADRPLRGPGAVGRAGRLGVDGGPAAARTADPAGAGGLRAARGVRVRLRRDRVGGRAVRRRRAASSRCGPGGTWTPAGPGSRPTGGSGRNWRRGSSTRSAGRRRRRACGNCWPRTSQMVGDGGGKAPALARSIVGVDKVARVLASVFPAARHGSG